MTESEAVIPVGSSSVNLIIPVQGAEGPAVGKNQKKHIKKVQLLALLQCAAGLRCGSHLGGGLCLRDPWRPQPQRHGMDG